MSTVSLATAFADFPADAKLWAYGLDRTMTADEVSAVRDRLDRFLTEWNSHGIPVTGAYAILENRIIVLSGYCADNIGGCSTDSSVRVIKSLKDDLALDGLNGSLVFFRDAGGAVQTRTRTEFQAAVKSGEIEDSTPVFDLTLTSVSDLRSRGVESTFADCWHARAFPRG